MKRIAVLICLVLLLAGLARSASPAAAKVPADVQTLVKGNNAFALDLYARLIDKEDNLFCSPYSISTALAMTSAGARGETAKQMAKALHFSLDSKRLHPACRALIQEVNGHGLPRDYQLSSAQSLWGDDTLRVKSDFQDLIRRNYGAHLRAVDFQGAFDAARQQINRWVEKQTNDKIKDLLHKDDIDSTTRMVLVNAIYFKAAWRKPFTKSDTLESADFHANGKKVKCALMKQTATFRYAEAKGLQVLELPFEGEELSMVVLLPQEKDGLKNLEKSLTAANLAGWLDKLAARSVVVELPRFKVKARFDLSKKLAAMGMPLAFRPGADFSGISDEELMISKVIHEAFADVNEAGAEAAAATAVVITRSAKLGEKPATFRADHPFVFLLRDKRTGSILFLGRLSNPSR